MKATTLIAVALTVTGSIGLCLLARPFLLRKAARRPWFTYSCSQLSAADYGKLAARPGWAKNLVEISPTVRLNGLTRRPRSKNAPWLLYYPGNDIHQLAMGQAFLERVSADHDWGLAVFSYRGYDSSTGTPSPEVMASDGAKVLEHLVHFERVDPAQLHVLAFSLGGYVAVNGIRATNMPIATLILFSSVAEAEMVWSGWAARISVGDVYRTVPALGSVSCPVLVLHGSADLAIPIEQGRQIAAKLSHARFEEITGAEHLLIQNEQAIDTARRYLEDALNR